MSVPNDHPELLGLLAGVLHGGSLGPLHDWLEERGDGRAVVVDAYNWWGDAQWGDARVADLMAGFGIEPCQTCQLNLEQPSCPECHGLGFSRLVTSEPVPGAKIPRLRAIDPKRVPLV